MFTDNGPQFSSQQFRDFASAYQFEHQTSSPHYPQSNGKVEKAVQTVKNILKKARDDKQDPYLALLALRNTPINDQIGSPSQQLMGRRTRTLLPTAKQLLTPKTICTSAVRRSIVDRQKRQKYYHDFSSTRLPPFSVGDNVMIKENKTWKPATVTGKANGPRSYLVTTPDGQRYRRNRAHLRHSPAHSYQDDEDDYPQPNRRDSDNNQRNTIQENPSDTANSESAVENQPLRRSARSVTRPERYAETHASHF